ncbi:MAG: hypothetical protein SGI92_33440 [Bryobacteraceae bacterium]|nr:hypothetical protein [Bryobacteraceae bacterium]
MRLFTSLALAAALTVPVMAQRGPHDGGYGRDRYDDRDYRNGRGNVGMGALDRVEQDLRSVASRGYNNSGDRRSLERALSDVARVRNDWQRKGRIDTGRVDNAARHIGDALRSGRMDPRERSILSRDIAMLQQLRNGGSYGNNGGYGPWSR